MALILDEVKQYGKQTASGKIVVSSKPKNSIGVASGIFNRIKNVSSEVIDGQYVWLKVVYRDPSFQENAESIRETSIWRYDSIDTSINRISTVASSNGGDGVEWDQTQDVIVYGCTPGEAFRGEGWHYVGEVGEPVFENSWVNYSPTESAGFVHLKFRKLVTGQVEIQGLVKDGATPVGTALFTLPEGYRPPNIQMFVGVAGSTFTRFSISPNGELTLNAANSAFTSVNCIFTCADVPSN